MFNEGDVVVSKEEFLEKNETLEGTLGIVISYNPDTDYLVLGSLHPEEYSIPPTYSMRGKFYRHISEEEKQKWNIRDTSSTPLAKRQVKRDGNHKNCR